MSEQEIATSLGELREICDRLWGRIVVLERRLEALEGEDVKGIGFTVPDNVTTTTLVTQWDGWPGPPVETDHD